PIVTDATGNATGQVVIDAGNTLAALGAGVRDGLGKMGAVDNPVGVTVASTGNVVTQAGHPLSSTGDLVNSLGQDQL
ncbi:collagen-like triple helix repeat-containing protein, partial [Acinetobacter baumannii]